MRMADSALHGRPPFVMHGRVMPAQGQNEIVLISRRPIAASLGGSRTRMHCFRWQVELVFYRLNDDCALGPEIIIPHADALRANYPITGTGAFSAASLSKRLRQHFAGLARAT
jgi:hypothetical protein